MPLITKISEQKRRRNRRNIYLDGRFAFGLNVNVVAKFRLRVGLELTPQQLQQIERGAVWQETFDAAMKFLERRMHSRRELFQKLTRKQMSEGGEIPEPLVRIVVEVLDQLTRLGYVNDERFAKTKALSAAEHKRQGRRRVFVDLMRSGVKQDLADRVLNDVYEEIDSTSIARELAQRQAPRLRKLDPIVARRRLTGTLLRRGFDYDSIRPVIDEVLGEADERIEDGE